MSLSQVHVLSTEKEKKNPSIRTCQVLIWVKRKRKKSQLGCHDLGSVGWVIYKRNNQKPEYPVAWLACSPGMDKSRREKNGLPRKWALQGRWSVPFRGLKIVCRDASENEGQTHTGECSLGKDSRSAVLERTLDLSGAQWTGIGTVRAASCVVNKPKSCIWIISPLLPRINKVKCKLIQLTLKKQQNLQVWGSPTVEGEYLI